MSWWTHVHWAGNPLPKNLIQKQTNTRRLILCPMHLQRKRTEKHIKWVSLTQETDADFLSRPHWNNLNVSEARKPVYFMKTYVCVWNVHRAFHYRVWWRLGQAWIFMILCFLWQLNLLGLGCRSNHNGVNITWPFIHVISILYFHRSGIKPQLPAWEQNILLLNHPHIFILFSVWKNTGRAKVCL